MLIHADPMQIPSPSQGVWHLGPLPIRAYALCIILGVIFAIWLGQRRWIARGGKPGQIADVAIWAVPFGLVGGRLYHVITDNDLYFGRGKNPWAALYVWQGGLGIWGAIALGGVGAYLACRRYDIKFPPLADALAPGIVIAQAIGRWGNWFNQELFGKPTNLPWGLSIDSDKRPAGYQSYDTFHPTFLYEFTWNLGVAALVIWADKKFRLGHGRAFALYVIGYTAGRGWIENLRIDPVQANDVFGLRLNVWTSIVVFSAAAVYFVMSTRLRPGREQVVLVDADPTGRPGVYEQHLDVEAKNTRYQRTWYRDSACSWGWWPDRNGSDSMRLDGVTGDRAELVHAEHSEDSEDGYESHRGHTGIHQALRPADWRLRRSG